MHSRNQSFLLTVLARTIWVFGASCLVGCQGARDELVVYCALDEAFARPILARFEAETGIHVRAKFDTESTKSVGLTELIRRERHRPRCDVFWNNEVLHTVRLDRENLLAEYRPSQADQFPAWSRSPRDTWHGFAARARVLLVNTDKLALEEAPATLDELTDPRWSGKLGMAKPLFGTTATHLAALFAERGPDATKRWLEDLKANNVRILSGNKQVAVDVGAGTIWMGLTDTDDALAEVRAGRPVQMIYLGFGAGESGVVLLPNTVSIFAGAPHRPAAERLVDFLLSPEVEDELARGPSGQIPLHPKASARPPLERDSSTPTMSVRWDEAAKVWDEMADYVANEFLDP